MHISRNARWLQCGIRAAARRTRACLRTPRRPSPLKPSQRPEPPCLLVPFPQPCSRPSCSPPHAPIDRLRPQLCQTPPRSHRARGAASVAVVGAAVAAFSYRQHHPSRVLFISETPSASTHSAPVCRFATTRREDPSPSSSRGASINCVPNGQIPAPKYG